MTRSGYLRMGRVEVRELEPSVPSASAYAAHYVDRTVQTLLEQAERERAHKPVITYKRRRRIEVRS